jgi:ABC-type antimicrobial peptide transport system permease subunit
MARINNQILKLNYKSAIASLKQSKVQSAVTILSLSLAAGALFTYLNLSSFAKHSIVKDESKVYISDQAVIKYSDAEDKLSDDAGYQYSLFKNCPEGDREDESESPKCIMADEKMLEILDLAPNQGQNLDQYSNEENTVIGFSVASSKFGSPADAVGKKINILNKDRTVIGVMPDSVGYNNSELSNVNDLAITGFYKSNVSEDSLFYILVSVDNESRLQEINSTVGSEIKFNKLSKVVDDPNSASDRSRMIFAAKQSAIVALFMSGLCVFISAMLSINKRVREIGIRKTIGATDSNITSHFLIESIVAGLAGSVLGSSISYAVITIKFNQSILDNLVYSIGDALLTLIGVLLISILAGIIPAKLAGKKTPIECLTRNN